MDAANWLLPTLLACIAGAAFLAVPRLRIFSGSADVPAMPPGAAVAMIDGGRVSALTGDRRLLPASPGDEVEGALRAGFGPAADEAVACLGRAIRYGEAGTAVVKASDGRLIELGFTPRGALVRMDLRDVSALAQKLSGEAARGYRVPEPWSLLAERAPLLVWQRGAPDGGAEAHGAIMADGTRVTAAEVVEMLSRRPPESVEGIEPAEGEPVNARLEVARPEGQRLALQVTEIPTGGGARIGFAVDASGAIAAERTLTRFVQTMTETFAHLTVALAIFDRNQTLALFNPALVELWRLEPAWLARRPTMREILDALRSKRRIPELRDYHAWREGLTGLFDDPEHADYEELWSLADGTTIRVLARPHPHGSVALIFDDVSERMRLEQRNRNMDDLIKATLDRLHEGLAVFAPNGALQFVNAAFHGIWDTDESTVTLDMHVSDLCALTRQLTVQTDVWDRMAAFVTGAETRKAWTARIALGSGRMLAARFAPLPDGSTMAVFADVTDSERIATALKERNEALEAAEQMRGAVLHQISHRLRTPLNTIFGFGELLASDRHGTLDDRQKDYAAGILEAAAQLLDTVSEVTDLASLQIDPLEGEETAAAIEEMLDLMRILLEKRASEAGVGLHVHLDGPVGLIDRNPVRMRQLVFNLAADALARCPAGGRVTLEARRDEDGTVEIATRETAVPGKTPALERVEMDSLTLSFVRRIVATEQGGLDISAPGDGTELRVACRFPELATVDCARALAQGQGPG